MIAFNKIFLRTFLLNAFVLVMFLGNAQQTPLQTHYFFQEHIINPAYTGSRTYDPIYLGYRNQWSDFPGSPATFTLGGHYAIDLNHGRGGGFFSSSSSSSYSGPCPGLAPCKDLWFLLCGCIHAEGEGGTRVNPTPPPPLPHRGEGGGKGLDCPPPTP